MTALVVVPTGQPLSGEVVAPGDKSVGHRALLFSLLSSTPVRIRGLAPAPTTAAPRARSRCWARPPRAPAPT
jgi:5-enolpyruvylshikimate-3-phosphate synthase